jgi:hypothetical protein
VLQGGEVRSTLHEEVFFTLLSISVGSLNADNCDDHAAVHAGTCSAEDMGQNSTLQKRKRLSSGLVAPEAIVTVDTSRIPMGILVTVPHSLNSTQGYNDGAAAVCPEMSSCLEIAQMAMSSHRETDKSSCLKSDGDKSRRSALEAHLVEQKEALRMQEKLVSDQVIQLVEKSNARLQGQLQALFAQMHMQVQVKDPYLPFLVFLIMNRAMVLQGVACNSTEI